MGKGRRRRADESTQSGLVLDAGALQALDKRHVRLLVDLRRAHDLGLKIHIPAGALAQSWRGGPRSASIARMLKHSCDVVDVDERSAREIGEFIATLQPKRKHPDIVDAHVALVTRRTRSLVWTSDRGDMLDYGVEPHFIRKL